MTNDYVSVSVGHLFHVLLTVYDATVHVTQKSHTLTNTSTSVNTHHPLNHNLAVIRTLLEIFYSIVSEKDDRKKEEHVATSLNMWLPFLDH